MNDLTTDNENLSLICQLAAQPPAKREEQRGRVVPIYAAAGKVNKKQARLAADQIKRDEHEAHKMSLENAKLSPEEIQDRVHTVRRQLETFAERLGGVHFDIVTHDMPSSLDYGSQKTPIDLVERVCPSVEKLYRIVNDNLPDEYHDELAHLRWYVGDHAFMLGILAGAMFSGASEDEINRLERGLVHALKSRPWEVRKD